MRCHVLKKKILSVSAAVLLLLLTVCGGAALLPLPAAAAGLPGESVFQTVGAEGEVYRQDGIRRDTEAEGIVKNGTPQQEEENTPDAGNGTAGSAIGAGSLAAIAVMAFAAAVVAFVFVTVNDRRAEKVPKEEEKKEERVWTGRN